MKTIKIAAIAAFAVISLPALAQYGTDQYRTPRIDQDSTPRIDQRQANQRERIERGLRNGQLTQREAERLFQHERRIRRMERMALADGRMSRSERAAIEQEQDQLSRRIARNMHDEQQRRY
jgi:uncharacterized membrane protein YebE (DUF533 family)